MTNSYLQAAAADLDPSQKNVFTLAGPGMCPGHFDMTPEAIDQLRNSRVLFRFDFQSGLEEQLIRLKRQGLVVQSVQAMEGLCIPDSYKSACEQMAEMLGQLSPQHRQAYQERLKQIQDRLDQLEQFVKKQIADSSTDSLTVVVSSHQVAFARWLGLTVAGTFSGRDQTGPGEIAECVKNGAELNVRIVIANQQEGVELARSLAERLNAKVVVFGNFPQVLENECSEPAFDCLVKHNVQALLDTLR